MNNVGTKVLAALVTSSLLVTPVMAAPSVDDLKKQKSEKENEVSSLQEQLTDIMDKLGILEEQLIAKGEEITQAQVDLEEAQEKEQEQYEAMKIRIKYMYEEGDESALETLVAADDFSDLLNKAEYVQNVHTYDREQLQEYIEIKQEIADLKASLEEDQKNMEAMQEDYKEQEQELDAAIESKKEEVEDLDSEIQAAAEAAAREAAERAAAAAAASSVNTSNTSTNTTVAKGDTATAQAILNAAYSQLGVPYVWGGTSPGSGLDCSGLVQYCHRAAGISLPRVAAAQGGGGMAVSDPQPGDCVCYGYHIGIYIGNGQMIHAPEPGDVVKISSVYGSPWYRRYW